jgi:Tol biopolymer transport system component
MFGRVIGLAALATLAALVAARASTGESTASFFSSPTWSPDGRQIAFAGGDQNAGRYDIYVMKVDGTSVRQLTHDTSGNGKAGLAWSPNGRWIAFQNYAYVDEITVDGAQQRRLSGYGGSQPDFSPSGRRIAYANGAAEFYSSIYVMRPDGTKKTLVAFPRESESLGSPTWSPEGEQLAFSVGTAADTDFVTPYLAIINQYRGKRRKLAVGHTIFSADWSPDGRRILLVEDPKLNDPRLNTRISILDVRTGNLRYLGRNATFTARWSPNGRRIVFSYFNRLFVMNADGSHVRDVTPA